MARPWLTAELVGAVIGRDVEVVELAGGLELAGGREAVGVGGDAVVVPRGEIVGGAAGELAVEAEFEVEVAGELAGDEGGGVLHAELPAHPVGLEHGLGVAAAHAEIVGEVTAGLGFAVGELAVVLGEGETRADDDPVAAGALDDAGDGGGAGVAERRAGRADGAVARGSGDVGGGVVGEEGFAGGVPGRLEVVGEERARDETVDLAVLEFDADGGLAVGLPLGGEVGAVLIVVAGGAPRGLAAAEQSGAHGERVFQEHVVGVEAPALAAPVVGAVGEAVGVAIGAGLF